MKRFSVHFNVHTHIQVVVLNNFENWRPLFIKETLRQESYQDR
jgi:hypothetical protein